MNIRNVLFSLFIMGAGLTSSAVVAGGASFEEVEAVVGGVVKAGAAIGTIGVGSAIGATAGGVGLGVAVGMQKGALMGLGGGLIGGAAGAVFGGLVAYAAIARHFDKPEKKDNPKKNN